MSSKFSQQSEKFEIIEHNVFDEEIDDRGFDPEAEVRFAQQQERSRQYEQMSTREKRRERRRQKKENKVRTENYGWAFFLCTMFLGIGVTTVLDHPIGVMMGLGFGFLFFVKPIYDKTMDLIERL